MKRNRLFALLCLVCTLSMLTGCWSDPPMDSMELPGQGSQEEPEEEVALPTSFALPYASDQTLDPVTCPDGIQQTVGSLLYEGLFRLDLQLEPQPWLCRSYSYDPATFTYTFTLRSGVTFSDGSALTAADVAARSPPGTVWCMCASPAPTRAFRHCWTFPSSSPGRRPA